MLQNRLFLILFVLSLFLGGCAGKNSRPDYTPILDEPPSYENIISHYYLQPGDIIDVKFFRNPKFNENVIVRPDGRIALQPDDIAITLRVPKRYLQRK